MSYQFPPAGDPNSPFGATPPTVQQPAVPFAPSPRPAGRRKGLIAAGLLVLVAGVAAGVVMMLASGQNYDDSVQNLARAPLGCTTALQFDKAGTFTVYVETKGSIGTLRGDCPATETAYSFTGDHLPSVDVVLTDANGDSVSLADDFTKDYDAAGSAGQSIASVQIDQPGTYDITVTSAETDFAVTIGKNPKDDADSLRTNGLIAGVAGVVVGAVLLLLGMRRRRTPQVPPHAVVAPTAPHAPPPQTWAPAPPAPPVPAPPAPGWAPAAPAPPPSGPQLNPPNWPAPPPAR